MPVPTPRRRLPRWGQGLLILIGGIIIGFGGCLTALESIDNGGGFFAVVGTIAFLGGVLAALAGIVVLLYGIVKALAPPGRHASRD